MLLKSHGQVKHENGKNSAKRKTKVEKNRDENQKQALVALVEQYFIWKRIQSVLK